MRLKQYLIKEATKVLKVYKNKRDGIESHVAKINLGYSVTIKDTDAGEFVGTSKIFKDEKDAHKYAKTIIKEDITIPINVGDVILGGRFKNKRITVKEIGQNEKGDITINGKPLLKYRLIPKVEGDENEQVS